MSTQEKDLLSKGGQYPGMWAETYKETVPPTPPEQEKKPIREFDPGFISFLQEKGVIDVTRRGITGVIPMIGFPGLPPIPIIQMGDIPVDVKKTFRDDFARFLKSKGYPIINEPLPSKEEAAAKLAQSTEELRQLYLNKFGATIGPISREKIYERPALAMKGPRGETIGPARPTDKAVPYSVLAELKSAAEKSFLDQAGDVMALLNKSTRPKTGFLPVDVTVSLLENKEVGQFFVDAGAYGVSAGIIKPELLDKLDQLYVKSGLSPKDYQTIKQRRENLVKEIGYQPEKLRTPISLVFQLIPLSEILKVANSIGASAKVAPIVQRLITGVVTGGVTGTAQIAGEKLAGEPFDLKKDLPIIPTHMLYWSLFEMGVLGAKTAAKIVNWNLRYGPRGNFFERMKSGKQGGYGAAQGIDIETQYAPGRGPTTRADFTVEEIRSIYFRGDPSYSGPGKIPVESAPDNWERMVYDSIREASGWNQAVHRGWMSPTPITIPGEPPIITGRIVRPTGTVPPSVGGEPVPLKPEWGDVFRGMPRQYAAPEIIGQGPGVVAPAPAPAPPPLPGTAGGPLPGEGGRPGMGATGQPGPSAPPPGSAPPAVAGAPRPEPGAAPPPPPSVEPPPIITPPPAVAAPKPKPKIKVTPQDDGSFTVETVTEPPPRPVGKKAGPPITENANWRDESVDTETRKERATRRISQIDQELELGAGAAKAGDTGEIQYQGELNKELDEINNFLEGRPTKAPADTGPAKPEPRKDQALRDAIARIQADEGAPEDVRLVAQAARRSERLKKVVEGLKAKQRTDLLTGVGSDQALAKQRGWEDRPVVLFDLAGVKVANNDPKRGYKWTDKNIFIPAGRVFRAFGDDRIYRRGGTADEFPLIGKAGQTLEDLTKDAELISQELDKTGVAHRFAGGKNFSEAEVGMAAAKDKGRVDATTSAIVPETLEELEKFIVSDEGSIPGEPYEYMTMTGNPADAIATMTKTDDGYFRIQRADDKTFVKSPRTGMPDFPNRNLAWKAYLEERKGRGLRDASRAEPSQRFIKSLEPPADRVRRILQSRRAAQAKRGRVGMPKNPPKIWKDIMEITGQAGMRPMFTSNGKIAEEYRVNVPKFMKNKNGKPPDEIIDALESDYGYTFGPEEDMWTLLARAKNETPGDYGEEGPGEEPDFEAIEEELNRQKAEYAPLMNEGEDLGAFLGRMATQAAEDGFGTRPEDIDEYIASLLKGKKGGGEPGAAGGAATEAPFLISVPEAKSQGLWWPGEKMPDGKPAFIIDPSDVDPNDPDVLSKQLHIEWDDNRVMNLEGWKSVIEKYMNSNMPNPKADENLLAFLQTLQRIFKETDGYGQGVQNGVAYSPPYMWTASIERGHVGYTGARVFQLKLLLAYDAIARLMKPMIGNPNFITINPLYMKPIRSGRYAGTLIGGFYEPQNGHMFINPFYIDEKALWDPWAMGSFIRDILTHEFTHYWVPTHNEFFTSKLKAIQGKMSDAWPYIYQIAGKVISQPVIVDKRKVYIPLGPGRKVAVDGQVIRMAGEETAKLIALAKEGPGGNKKLYLATKPEGKPGEPAAGRGPAGKPGPPSGPGAGGKPELAYPRSDAEARAAGLGVRKEPGLVGRDLVRDHDIKNLPEAIEYAMDDRSHGDEDFAIAARQLAIDQFGTTDVDKIPAGDKGDAARFLQEATDRTERVGDIYELGEFKEKEAPPFIQEGIRKAKMRPSLVSLPDLPPQKKIPDKGIWTALRTDDGGIYFGTEPNHYLLAEKLGLPKERIVGGGFIKDGDYIESPWSEAGRIGRDAREALGLPRERYYSMTLPNAEKVAEEVRRLTSGEFFPREWQGNTDTEVQDNRQNLIRFILENYKPEMGPLENYINANKGFYIRGEAGRKGMDKIKRERQFPKLPSGEEVDFGEEKSVFAPESQPKGKKPPEPEMPGDTMKPDVFGAEEIRLMNALRSTAQAYTKTMGEAPTFEDKAVDILKARLLSSSPESFRSIAERLGYSKSYVKKQYDAMLEILKDSPVIKEIMAKRMIQLNIGPVPTEEELKHLAKLMRKFFSSYRGADKIIDRQNDVRIGGRMAEIFDQTIDASKINKWLKDQPEGTNEYIAGLMRGTISGDGTEDIQNSALPEDIKRAMLNTRHRVDRLSDLVITHGGLAEETRVVFENNIGKYLAKAYRLYEQTPHGVWPLRTGYWSPTEAQKDAFKRWLMNEYTMTPEQADDFIEAELAYGRNDEGIRPQRSRRTRRVPTEHFIRRRVLSPAWREFAGEIDRLPWLVMHTITKQATMAYNARFLDWISEYLPDHWTASYQEAAQRGWQNSQFAEHNYAYGKLAGKWVDPELYQYIKSEFDTARSDMEEMIQKFIMNPFKWTKTIGSLPSQSRNFLSNFGFSMLLRNSILNPLNAKWYIKSALAHLNKSGSAKDLWKKMIEEGVTETQFYGAEIPRMHTDIMRFDPATWPEKIWDKFIAWPIDKFGELYNFGDSLYRVSAYLHDTRGRGMSPEKAVEELNAGLQNYRKLPVIVDIFRRWPVLGPFISFKANTVKIIGNQARMAVEEIKVPATRSRGISRYLRLALFLSIPAILSEISKKIYDVDDKQIKELERWYPEYRRNGTFLYLRGEGDKLKVFDFSFLWPTGDIERFGKSILKGDIAGAKDSLDFFSHPLLDVWSILINGQDPQWGTKYRTIVDQAKAAAAYLYRPASMPIPNLKGLLKGHIRPGNLTGPQIKAVIDAYNGQPDQYGRVKQLPEEIKNFFTGIRTWDVDPEKLLAQATLQRRGQIRDLQGEMTKWMMKNTLAPQWEKDDKINRFKGEVEVISAELNDIGALYKELQAGGFKAKTK